MEEASSMMRTKMPTQGSKQEQQDDNNQNKTNFPHSAECGRRCRVMIEKEREKEIESERKKEIENDQR